MNVKELIEKLDKLNPDAVIQMQLVSGVIPVDDALPDEYIGIVNLVCYNGK